MTDIEWKARECLRLVDNFINDNQITCAEVVTQTDWVIQNAYDFIEELCETVGYHDMEDE